MKQDEVPLQISHTTSHQITANYVICYLENLCPTQASSHHSSHRQSQLLGERHVKASTRGATQESQGDDGD